MTTLIRHSPFSAEPFADAFEGFLRPIRGIIDDGPRMDIDITENDSAYILQAEIPGVEKGDITVDIDGNEVRIGAKKSSEKETKDDRSVRRERYSGELQRVITLASSVDESKAVATYQNGVLKLMLPKKAGDSRHRLTIG